MSLPLLSIRREERELELADLHLVASAQLRSIDLLAVDVRAVEAPSVDDEPLAAVALHDRVLAGHGHVVEEHRAVGVTPNGRLVTFEQEGRPCVRATLHQQQSLARVEGVVGERELLGSFLFGFDRRKGHGDVSMQWMTTLDAEPRIITVGMSTTAAEQPARLLGPRVP